MSAPNRDQLLFDKMIELKRHLRSCRQCQAAVKAADEYNMCRQGLRFTLLAAGRYDHLIKLRAKALRDKAGTVFACPDLSAHGQSYALTALPLHVTGIQDRMF